MSAEAAVDQPALHALLVERVDVRKWGTAIVVGISSPEGRRVVSYGTLAVNDSRKVDGATVFEIASLTKVFTALVLADMVGRQQLKLDAPVSTCLPAGTRVPQHGGKQITFVDLATHSSGSAAAANEPRVADGAEQIRRLHSGAALPRPRDLRTAARPRLGVHVLELGLWSARECTRSLRGEEL